MAFRNVNYIVFDFETGGLDCEKNPITQVGLIVLNGRTLQEIERYQTYVQNYSNLEYDKKALDYTGITMDDINSGKPLRDVVADLISIFTKSTEGSGRYKMEPVMVGHNIDKFDMDFLDYIFNACGKDVSDYISRTTKDTMMMAVDIWQVDGIEKVNLQACCEKTQIDLVGAHDAMNDVQATADLFRYFIKQMRGESSDFNSEERDQRFRSEFKF